MRQLCYGFTPSLLIPSGDRHVSIGAVQKKDRKANAWELRDDFLRMPSDEASARVFLNKWGNWSHGYYVELPDILHLQKVVRDALTGSPEKWWTGYMVFLPLYQRLPEYPYFAVITNACELAIRMTVTIDLLRRLKFKTCGRRDCRLPFAIESKHKRKYCSQYCGHLESVRRNRKLNPEMPKGKKASR